MKILRTLIFDGHNTVQDSNKNPTPELKGGSPIFNKVRDATQARDDCGEFSDDPEVQFSFVERRKSGKKQVSGWTTLMKRIFARRCRRSPEKSRGPFLKLP
jgi:hypothetical protein